MERIRFLVLKSPIDATLAIEKIVTLKNARAWVSMVFTYKGPSINDVSPKGEEGGYKKCPKRRRLRFEETRGGRVPQKSKIWGDVVYGWSLK